MENLSIFWISTSLNIKCNNMKDFEETKIAEIENTKESELSAEVGFSFSDKPLQEIWDYNNSQNIWH